MRVITPLYHETWPSVLLISTWWKKVPCDKSVRELTCWNYTKKTSVEIWFFSCPCKLEKTFQSMYREFRTFSRPPLSQRRVAHILGEWKCGTVPIMWLKLSVSKPVPLGSGPDWVSKTYCENIAGTGLMQGWGSIFLPAHRQSSRYSLWSIRPWLDFQFWSIGSA